MNTAPGRCRRALLAGLALISLAGAAPAMAQDGAKKDAPKQDDTFAGGTVLVIEHAALDTLFSDPKDKAMGDALAMIPKRAAELPREVPDMPPEAAGLVQMILSAIARPGRLTVAYDETPTGGFFGYGIDISVLTAGKDEAIAMQTNVMGLLSQADQVPPHKASTRFTGMREIQLPVGLLAFGPREAKDGWRYEIVVGTMPEPDIGAAALPAPMKGVQSCLRGRIDLSGLTPALKTVQMFAGARPELQEARKQLETYGLIGPKAMKLSFQMGQTQNESVSFATVEGAGRVAEAAGLSRAPLDKADLGAIPADAYTAAMSRSGGWVSKLIARAREKSDEVGMALDQFKQLTDVELEGDLLASLGDVSGYYTSESTGGGGIGSTVLMLSVKDRAKLKESIGKLAEFANTMSKSEAHGYVRVSNWSGRNGVDMFSLQFPGVPVPLELTAALTDKWLLITPTPQGAIVAGMQATAKEGGLMANAAFAAAMPKDLSVSSLKFADTARNMHQGYTFLTMLGSGVANLVRSPSDPTRSPNLTVPTFPELKKGVRPALSWGMWKGDDYVFESHADHSVLVNATSTVSSLVMMAPAFASIASQAQNAARERMQSRPTPPPVKPRRSRQPKEESEDLISRADRAGAMLVALYEAEQIVPSPEAAIMAITGQAALRDGE